MKFWSQIRVTFIHIMLPKWNSSFIFLSLLFFFFFFFSNYNLLYLISIINYYMNIYDYTLLELNWAFFKLNLIITCSLFLLNGNIYQISNFLQTILFYILKLNFDFIKINSRKISVKNLSHLRVCFIIVYIIHV